jgi:hypothetical protein
LQCYPQFYFAGFLVFAFSNLPTELSTLFCYRYEKVFPRICTQLGYGRYCEFLHEWALTQLPSHESRQLPLRGFGFGPPRRNVVRAFLQRFKRRTNMKKIILLGCMLAALVTLNACVASHPSCMAHKVGNH